jgi:hypothetical protein
VSAVDLYRRHAVDCLWLASESVSEETRATLIDMAQSWARLAQQAEKNSQLDLVYESAPAARRAVRPPQLAASPPTRALASSLAPTATP